LTPVASPNFAVLAQHDEIFGRYAMLADRYAFDDPTGSSATVRAFAGSDPRRHS